MSNKSVYFQMVFFRYHVIAQMFTAVNADRPVELKRIFDHLADKHTKRRYREPRRSSGAWTTMVDPPELVDRTLNLEQSVFPIPENDY